MKEKRKNKIHKNEEKLKMKLSLTHLVAAGAPAKKVPNTEFLISYFTQSFAI
jgi:hypothetical protein